MILLAGCEGGVGMAAARRCTEDGGSALDAVEQGIRPVEADERVKSVGRGGAPNLLGEVECDAAIMDGTTLQAGAVGALRGYLHAITVARRVMEQLPYVFLVGTGAERFARESGAETADLLTDHVRERHERWLAKRIQPEDRGKWPDVALARYVHDSSRDYVSRGTTILLARDAEGNSAAGASTSGWPESYPGRVGDTPVIGAGLYADSHYGACACTHTGEMTLRTVTARSVVLYMKQGASVQEACAEAREDLRALRGGVLGPVVIHAMDFYGNPCVLTTDDLGRNSSYHIWRDGMSGPEQRQAEVAKERRG